MSNTAETHLQPEDPNTVHVAFLYVGQGECTLLVAPDGNGKHIYVLIDTNHDGKYGGTDITAMLEDLLPKNADGKPVLDVLVNTHPHADHIGGLKRLAEAVEIKSVWHTGFEPSKSHEGPFKDLEQLIKDSEDVEYNGSRTEAKFGEVSVDVLSPAPHVKEEIDKETGDARDKRIHEYCGVLRLRYGDDEKAVLITGDADKAAWQDHITGYHSKRLKSDVLSAVHHGSRTFFKKDKDDKEPYKEHLETIDPDYLIISSPKQSESPHNHPHDDALDLYKEVLDEKDIFVLGEERDARIVAITKEGVLTINSDDGALATSYPSNDTKKSTGKSAVYVPRRSKIDSGRGMG